VTDHPSVIDGLLVILSLGGLALIAAAPLWHSQTLVTTGRRPAPFSFAG
jgi:hypothetical protein